MSAGGVFGQVPFTFPGDFKAFRFGDTECATGRADTDFRGEMIEAEAELLILSASHWKGLLLLYVKRYTLAS